METSKSTLEVVATHALGVPFATWRGTQVRHETSCWVQAPATTNPVTRLYLKCVVSMIALCLVYTHLQGFAMCTCHSYQGLDCGLTNLPEPTGFGSMPTRRLGLGVVPHPDLAKSGPVEPRTGCCMAVCTYAAALTVAHQHGHVINVAMSYRLTLKSHCVVFVLCWVWSAPKSKMLQCVHAFLTEH